MRTIRAHFAIDQVVVSVLTFCSSWRNVRIVRAWVWETMGEKAQFHSTPTP